MNKPVIILGAGGHSAVLIDILRKQQRPIIALVAPKVSSSAIFENFQIFQNENDILKYSPEDIGLVNGVGSLPGSNLRHDLFTNFSNKGYQFETIIDESAIISPYAILMQGVQVMAGVVIQTGSQVGENTIVNTGAIIDHDCQVGSSNHIAPGSVLSGNVITNANVHIGTGAQIIQSIQIEKNAIIGAGTTITKNVFESEIIFPARNYVKKGRL
ncbi:acetyltransferase [Paremcibacter congregatus]|uniref:acetyltransferase n=1 Tax=Paremcibacter congregatus TaxID=2043170 RepID=UPI0030EBCECB|tara:strand:+ start:6764 stop:7405 length:642 start_codon:yes stop_codon:yes gene_type:complete